MEGLKTELSNGSIDETTLDIVERFAQVPCCHMLQSCFGHFMKEFRVEDRNTKRVAEVRDLGTMLHYRIAYIAFCIQNSVKGRALLEETRAVALVNPDYIQFGSADWFWKICANSYVLQVSPLRNAYQDHFDVNLEETLRIEHARDRFFDGIREVLARSKY